MDTQILTRMHTHACTSTGTHPRAWLDPQDLLERGRGPNGKGLVRMYCHKALLCLRHTQAHASHLGTCCNTRYRQLRVLQMPRVDVAIGSSSNNANPRASCLLRPSQVKHHQVIECRRFLFAATELAHSAMRLDINNPHDAVSAGHCQQKLWPAPGGTRHNMQRGDGARIQAAYFAHVARRVVDQQHRCVCDCHYQATNKFLHCSATADRRKIGGRLLTPMEDASTGLELEAPPPGGVVGVEEGDVTNTRDLGGGPRIALYVQLGLDLED